MNLSNLILTGCLLLSISLTCAQEPDELDLDSFEHALQGHSGHHAEKENHKEPAPVVEISEEDDGLAVDDGALVADTDANALPITEATLEVETEAEIQTDPPTTTTTTTTTTTEKVTTTKATTLKPHDDQHHYHGEKQPTLPTDATKSPSLPSGSYPGPLLPGSPADFLRPGSFVNPYAQPPYIAGGYSPYNPDGTLKTPPTPDRGISEENEITKDDSAPSIAGTRNQFPTASSYVPSFGGLASIPGARILPTGLVPIPSAEKPTTDRNVKTIQPIDRRITYPYRPTSFLPWRPYPLLPGTGIIHPVPPKSHDADGDADDDIKEESTTTTEETSGHYGGGGRHYGSGHYGGGHYGGGHYGSGHYGSGHYGGGHYGGGHYGGYGHHEPKGYAYWRS